MRHHIQFIYSFSVVQFFYVFRLVKSGGVLVYSTCSIDPEENEERMTAFLLRHPVRWLCFRFYAYIFSSDLLVLNWNDNACGVA